MDHRARIDGIGALTGIAPWKRERVAAMFAGRHGPPIVSDAAEAVRLARANGGAVACWESRHPAGLAERAADAGVPVWSIEDGFIRSAGLGAALVQPCSLVLDRQGVHYNAAAPSELEQMLAQTRFNPETLDRADSLIDRLRRSDITKYNLAGPIPDFGGDREVVLILGQVDDDLSVLQGGGGMTVAAMIERVRELEAGCRIVFRPHPDVTAGLRVGVKEAAGCSDGTGYAFASLLRRAKRVHTLTSLGGLEALVRGCEVVVHGQPFYAGWGLTQDLMPPTRNRRTLSLEQLLAATLIDYPIYFDPKLGKLCSVEHLLDQLEQHGAVTPPGWLARLIGLAAQRLRWDKA